MDLSIIIVNYNVKYFLEQCLYAVRKASNSLETEVFVVDNQSTDGSQAMVKAKFPEVRLIDNRENVGFARANNQAIREATGRYVLLLNPDTVVEEETFRQTVAFMDAHHDAGALGVKMLDGKGVFLPESKRGLPTPAVAFYKIFGLSALFPHSKRFGRYHLRYLHLDETHEVEVLAGAFMLLRHSVLDEIGLLDETFFMYGEDIDLSYRVILGGYKNYYYPTARIIHYKGESTKKESVRYVKVFYQAMIIFAKKHFRKNGGWFSGCIRLAVALRAGLALLKRFAQSLISSIFKKPTPPKPAVLLLGSDAESCRVEQLLQNLNVTQKIEKLTISPSLENCRMNSSELAQSIVNQLKINQLNEVVFCSQDLTIQQIIDLMIMLPKTIEMKIAPAHCSFVIGSHSVCGE